MSEAPQNTGSGFASVIGLPNAGKSTLVNALVGSKVSIVSRKVQTTRMRVLGIVMQEDTQIILMDTPGIFEPKRTLERAMVRAAWDTVPDADVVVHIVDAANPKALEINADLISKLPAGKPCFLAMNKVDKVKKEALLAMVQSFQDRHPYDEIFMISALKQDGLDALMTALADKMPDGPYLYDPEQITDLPMRMLASEITREKIYDLLHQELPYATFVETEAWEEFDNGSVKISQIVYVDRDSQKGIVLGKGGSKIKAIGEAARHELSELLERPVHVKLHVKVQTNWAERAENYRLIGLEKPV